MNGEINMNKEMSERQMRGMKKEIISDIQRALDEEIGKRYTA